MIFIFTFGFIRLSQWKDKESDLNWRVATLQHSADSWQGGYETYKRNFNTLRTMSLQALQQNPDMILWSETALSLRLARNLQNRRSNSQIGRRICRFW